MLTSTCNKNFPKLLKKNIKSIKIKHTIISTHTIGLIITYIIFLSFPLFSSAEFNGSSDTTIYTQRENNCEQTGPDYQTRIQEWILFDYSITDNISFHLNNRYSYNNYENEDLEKWDLNLYYSYFELSLLNDYLNIQIGRMLDVNNFIYLFYDGCNMEYKLELSKHEFSAKITGGLIVNDDYLEDETEEIILNSYDYRNIFKEQRKGDYITGAKFKSHLDDILLLEIDYQAMLNKNELAEHYLSVNFDTLFSKKIQLFGYGTIDLIEEENSITNSLIAARLHFIDPVILLLQHEYFRPVFMKDSYFRDYFEPFGNHEASAHLVYLITNKITADLKYGRLFYDSTSQYGNSIACSIEHSDLNKFRILLNCSLLNGPEGENINVKLKLKRQVSIFKLLYGAGISLYRDDINNDIYTKAYFTFTGIDAKITKSLILSGTCEYYTNSNDYDDTRGIFSIKYLF